jgi:hypothetical protein
MPLNCCRKVQQLKLKCQWDSSRFDRSTLRWPMCTHRFHWDSSSSLEDRECTHSLWSHPRNSRHRIWCPATFWLYRRHNHQELCSRCSNHPDCSGLWGWCTCYRLCNNYHAGKEDTQKTLKASTILHHNFLTLLLVSSTVHLDRACRKFDHRLSTFQLHKSLATLMLSRMSSLLDNRCSCCRWDRRDMSSIRQNRMLSRLGNLNRSQYIDSFQPVLETYKIE